MSKLGANVSRSKAVPYFHSQIGSSLTPAGRQLLENYSRLPESELEAHIYKIVSGLKSAPHIPNSVLTNLSVT